MTVIRAFLATVLLFMCLAAQADDLLMVRSSQDFPETMLALQEAIKAEGYRVARVQRVDIGLTGRGFQTDKYRVVFFGKEAEIASLLAHHPELSPYLPLKLVIFAEGSQTLVVTMNPLMLSEFYPGSSVEAVFGRWAKDVQSILKRVSLAQ